MGSVIEREGKNGDKLYYLCFFDADDVQRMRAAKHPDGTRARTFREATTLLHDEESKARAGVKIAKAKATEEEQRRQKITIRELAKRFVEEAQPLPRKGYRATPRVIKNYRSGARSLLKRHILDRLGDRAAASITSEDVDKLREQILEKFADDTCGKAMGVLSRLYGWAKREKLIACANPCSGVARPKETAGCPDYLTDEQCGKLIAWLERDGEPMLHAMVVLVIFSGVRKGEAFGLTWRDVHFDAKRLDVEHSYDGTTKNGVIDSAKLHDNVIPVLKRWQQMCPETEQGLVFPVATGKGGTNSKPTAWRMGHENDMVDIHSAMQKALGRMWDRPWHLLRHTFASALVRRGVPLYTVGKLLRDKNPLVVMRYAKLSPDHLATEVDRLAFPAPKPDATVTSIDVARIKTSA